eukprot:CAMPEP_0117679048 /NCGR_PEP_ID=MMETSP0804-20121206/17617_1 /TAXON_ID=1074897 /ORGANISM="Tetraselmis astigmatica, Strain CCMP880" /LENGTH=719 /DNA_ID=CAMNT_0005488465 /DNA_START=219 /DNA_END=2378 /DNA_ORIENTATION=+
MEPTGAAPEAHPSSTWRTTAWRVLRGAGKAFRTSSTVVGATVLVTAGVGAYVASDVKKKSLTLPDEFVLDLDLQACEVVEQLPPPFQRFGGWRQVLVRDLVDAFEEAGKDPRVKGVLAKLPDGQGPRLGGFAQVHELRSAITRFRLVSAERQVPCTAYADTFGSTQSYYLASSFQDVFLQPSGMVMCNGLASKVPFLRGLLDSWKIVPLARTREEYKNAANSLSEKGYTRAHKEANTNIVQTLSSQIFEGIAVSRGISVSAVRQAVDLAPLSSGEAVSRKLVTACKYLDEVEDDITGAGGPPGTKPLKKVSYRKFLAAKKAEAKLQQKKSPLKEDTPSQPAVMEEAKEDGATDMTSMEARKPAPGSMHAWWSHWSEKGFAAWWNAMTSTLAGDEPDPASEFSPFPKPPMPPKVALVYAVGPITTINPGQQTNYVSSVKVCKELRKLRKDPTVKAVVMRVDSPGGSAYASDAIRREVDLLKEAGKPVVVSMGNVAASGGYYISCSADKILASPSTITGSIGVVLFKLDVSALLEEKGVNVETIKAGKNADLFSLATGFSPEQERSVNRLLDAIYDDFLQKVAAGRGMSVAAVKKVAKGKIHMGAHAKAIGLVDELGGLNDALRIAKQMADLPEDTEVVPWPAPASTFEAIMNARKEGQTIADVGQQALQGAGAAAAEPMMASAAAAALGSHAAAESLLGHSTPGPRTSIADDTALPGSHW